MHPEKVIIAHEESENRLFVIKERADFNKVALRLLRERNQKRMYPSSDNVRQALQEDLLALQEIYAVDSPEYAEKIEEFSVYYKIILEFALKLEELLSLPKEEALDLEWDFEDGDKTPLAYILLSMRRHFKFEGYSIIDSEYF